MAKRRIIARQVWRNGRSSWLYLWPLIIVKYWRLSIMMNYKKDGYFTGWQYDDETRKSSHRIYYNDIDIATANLLCNGVVVGNALNADKKMQEIDKKANYMW